MTDTKTEGGREREQERERKKEGTDERIGKKGGHVQSGGVENECREVGSERATGRVRERRGGGERTRQRNQETNERERSWKWIMSKDE